MDQYLKLYTPFEWSKKIESLGWVRRIFEHKLDGLLGTIVGERAG
jgi:hypothetical protein